jgi:hypothetical protein
MLIRILNLVVLMVAMVTEVVLVEDGMIHLMETTVVMEEVTEEEMVVVTEEAVAVVDVAVEIKLI